MFFEIVDIIKESKIYVTDKYNVATIIIDKSGIKLDIEYHDMDASEYRVQKEWKQIYIIVKLLNGKMIEMDRCHLEAF